MGHLLPRLALAALAAASACSASRSPAPAESGWTREIGAATSDSAGAVATDPAGNVLVAGTTSGDLGGPSAGGNDAFVVKLDPTGGTLWARQLGGADDDSARCVASDLDGNVLVAVQVRFGGYETGAFVAKLDPAGATSWVKELTATGTPQVVSVHAVASDPDGNVLVAGETTGVIMGPGLNAGGRDAFVVKLDPSGELLWRRQVGTAEDDLGRGVSADGSGNVYLAGGTRGSLFEPTAGGEDAFVMKLDPGNSGFVWTRQLGSTGSERAASLATDAAGNVLVAGFTDAAFAGTALGSEDAFVLKLDPTGQTTVWARQLGTAGGDRPGSIALAPAGVLVAGSSCCQHGVGNAFVHGLDPDGVTSWTRTLAAAPSAPAYVASDGSGNVFVAGTSGHGALVVSYGPDGTPR